MENNVFTDGTRIIGGKSPECLTTLFRKHFSCSEDIRGELCGVIRIAAREGYVLYINGSRVLIRELKSYDFHKYYDELDISRFLTTGENCVAVESTGAVIAEVTVNGRSVCRTDEEFRCKGNDAYRKDTLGIECLLTLGKEEWFDSRKLSADWIKNDFDDSEWEEAVCVEDTVKWSGYNPYRGDFLTQSPVYGRQVIAELVSHPHRGRKMNIIPAGTTTYRDSGGQDILQMYVSEIICEKETEFELIVNRNRIKDNTMRITIDGEDYRSGSAITLSQGSHLLCISVFGSCQMNLYLPQGILSAEKFCGGDYEFAGMEFTGKAVRFPWHEPGKSIISQIPEIAVLHGCKSAAELEGRFVFLPVISYGDCSFSDMVFQDLYFPEGGECPEGLFGGKKIEPVQEKNPIIGSRNLLKAGANVCEIKNDSDYDAMCIIDLGKETCGYVSFKAEAKEGQVLDFQCFELCDGGGIALMENHNGFRYIAHEGYQEYCSFNRFGFRYIIVTVRGKGKVRFHDLHVEETLYPVDYRAEFRCDDAMLNQIYEMCLNTSSLCMLDTYVDCPGREQHYWTGDANITARNNIMHFGEYTFNQHCISLIGQSLRKEYVEQFYPNDKQHQENKYLVPGLFEAYPIGGLPMWAFLWVQSIWEQYLYSGNEEYLRENYEYLKKNLANAENMINSRGLIDIQGSQNLIEWANNDLSPYGEVTIHNVYLVNSFRIASKIAEVLEYEVESEDYQKKAEAVYAALNALCWNEEKQGYVDTLRDAYGYERYCRFYEELEMPVLSFEDYLACTRISEQTNTLALLYDCVPDERKEAVLAIASRVKDGIYKPGSPANRTVGEPKEGETRDGIVMIGSPYFLYFSLGTLWKYNMADEALKIIRKEWGKMLAMGVNTCLETMVSGNAHYTGSICHAWSAGPSIYLTEEVLGIKPLAAGYRKFTVEPNLCDLNWVQGSVATPYGNIYAKVVKKEDGTYEITCKAPASCERIK